MWRLIRQFIADAGTFGFASSAAAVVSYAFAVWEHVHDRPVSSFALVSASVLLFWIGAFNAWKKQKQKSEVIAKGNSPQARRHFEAIKMEVIQPLAEWVGNLLSITRGESGVFILASAALGDPFKLVAVTISEGPGFSEILFDDAAKAHFPEQMAEFRTLREHTNHLLAHLLSFAQNCCSELWKTTKLPPPIQGNRTVPFVDFELMLRTSFRFLVAGTKPVFYIQSPSPDGTARVESGLTIDTIARDRADALHTWFPQAISLIETYWKESGLSGEIAALQREALRVSQRLDGIRLKQTLPGSCEYL